MLVDRFAELGEGGDVEDLGSEEILMEELATSMRSTRGTYCDDEGVGRR
jgi:hypothetical protein